MRSTIISIFFLTLSALSASAYWPIRPGENLAIHADSTIWEGYCTAHPAGEDNIVVVFFRGGGANGVGICYQYIDKYGQLLYPTDMPVAPSLTYADLNAPFKTITDGNKGVYIVWYTSESTDQLLAQHIDSLGTRLWSDSGIVAHQLGTGDFNLSLDNQGGLYIAVSPNETGGGWSDLYLQHISSFGNYLWGESGILIADLPNTEARYPVICPDTSGGCFLVWQDSRPPYGGTGALFAQHIDFSGNVLWTDDLYITSGAVQDYGIKTIPDESGGFILQSNVNNLQYNHHRRINGSGNILWVRDHLSYWSSSPMVAGEPGFFYLGWKTGDICNGQRVDMNGNSHWPVGAAFNSWSEVSYYGDRHFFYSTPYFYVFYCIINDPNPIRNIYIQALDSLYNRQYGTNGQLFSVFPWPWGPYYVNPVVNNNGDVTVVFEYNHSTIPGGGHDVWAKRMNADGTLGGPNAPIEDVTIAVSGNDVVLRWPAMALNADYKIYKSAVPYFQPAEPDTVVQDTVFVDIGAILGDSCFYRIGWNPR